MKFVIFGLSVSSSWGNGHATLWRALCKALHRHGHHVVFFERDVPYYATHRDLTELPGGRLHLYTDWADAVQLAEQELRDAEVGMVTSYCPDGIAATEFVLDSNAELKVFYDLDTPVTLAALRSGAGVSYIGPRGLADFDLVLSYTGGAALEQLQTQLGAKRVAPIYGSVDLDVHSPGSPLPYYQADLSYLGTYAEDRQPVLNMLFIEAARRCPDQRFLIGGAQYPQEFPWTDNIYFVKHVPPADHPAFYASSRLTLNVTRKAMAEMGYCPSGRLFEAAACGVPLLTDWWTGLDTFFEPDRELIVAHSTDDVVAALRLGADELANIARAARERVLAQHTADQRVRDLEEALNATKHAPADAAPRAHRPTGASLLKEA